MNALDPNNQLFKELEKNPPIWWTTLIADKDIYIDVRKGNYLDVYFNGGNIIRELEYKDSGYSGKIHYKYLLPQKAKYIDFNFQNSSIEIANKKVALLSLNNLDITALKRIKDNITKFYPTSSEKGIQAKFVTKTEFFIDSEFAFNNREIKLRIDLVWIDIINEKIILVELKSMGDSRLYTNEIKVQLKKYNEFAKEFSAEITEYYQKVFAIKSKLNLLSAGLQNIKSLNAYTLETKPLLLLGDCEQKWIDNNAKDINYRIKDVAIGAYYFGKPKYSCDLIKTTKGNRFIFQK